MPAPDIHARSHLPGGVDPIDTGANFALLLKTASQSIGSGSSAFLTWDDFYTSDDTIFGTTSGGTSPPFSNTAGDTTLVCAGLGIYVASLTVEWEYDAATYSKQVSISKSDQLGSCLSTRGAAAATASLANWQGASLDVGDVMVSGYNASGSLNPTWKVLATNLHATSARSVLVAALTVAYWPAKSGSQVF